MRKFKKILLVPLFVALTGCSISVIGSKEQSSFTSIVEDGSSVEERDRYDMPETENNADVDAITGATKAEVKIAVLAGGAYGGLVHNDNMRGINGVSGIDAITGATKVSSNAGIHLILTGHGRTVETGLDYVNLSKSINYEMPSLSVDGLRDFKTHQFRLPLTYNFGFFKNDMEQTRLVLKVGVSAGYTFSKTIEDSEDSQNLPEYEFSDWDVCGKIGFSYYFFNLNQKSRLGIYIDAYRGFKAYKDVYHESAYLGGNAFMKFGFVFEP
jgi:hypothetical protein